MAKQNLVIDLTREQTACCLLDSSKSFKLQVSSFKAPLKAIVFIKSGELHILTGEPAEIYYGDGNSLVFYNLIEDLPAIEDEYVQIELIKSFWSSVCFIAARRFRTTFEHNSAGFIIYPQNYPTSLLKMIRAACSQSKEINNVVFINEASALIFGLLCSNLLKISTESLTGQMPQRIGVVLGLEEEYFEVICFDYSVIGVQTRRILIRDYFQTTKKNLVERLRNCNWKDNTISRLFVESSNKDLDFNGIAQQLQKSIPKFEFAGDVKQPFSSLKSLGAAHIAKYSMAKAESFPQFELINTVNIGIQTDRRHFYPVLQKEIFQPEATYPCYSAKTFNLSGTIAQSDLTFSVHASYSELIEESSVLGFLTLDSSDLSLLTGKNKSDLVAVAQLKSPGEGEFVLGLMPDNRIVGRLPFVLPGLIC